MQWRIEETISRKADIDAVRTGEFIDIPTFEAYHARLLLIEGLQNWILYFEENTCAADSDWFE